jgi:thiol-disulfide isomerase/thioredoxin
MKKIITKKALFLTLALAFTLSIIETKAQLTIGSTAPDWTFTDIKGTTQTLYSYLNQGKTVVIDVSATWCGPCWAYHTSGELENFYKSNGPAGTNKAVVLFLEGDGATNTACLSGSSGCNSTTQGNWVTGTPYPIVDVPATQVNSFKSAYKITYYPTLFVICPDKKIALASAYNSQTNSGQFIFTAAELKTAMDAKCKSTTSIAGEDIDSYVSVYPNPSSSGNVFVSLNGAELGQVKVKIYNVVGTLVLETNANTDVNKQIELNLKELNNGMYFINVVSDKGRTTQKIMLNK